MSKMPDTIQSIIDQIKMFRWGSAFIQNGVDPKTLRHRCPRQDGECRPEANSRFEPETGVMFTVGLLFKVNGKTGEDWTQVVCYEQDDTYTVYMTRMVKQRFDLIGCRRDVYCDELNEVLCGMYNTAINQHNGGMISFS